MTALTVLGMVLAPVLFFFAAVHVGRRADERDHQAMLERLREHRP